MRFKRNFTMLAAVLLFMSAFAQSNNRPPETVKNKVPAKVKAQYAGSSWTYHDACPYLRPSGYIPITRTWIQIKADLCQELGIDQATFEEHFSDDAFRDQQYDFQQYEMNAEGNFVARAQDEYIGEIANIIEPSDGSSTWRWGISAADVQKIYTQWNQETYRNTEKTYELSVAIKFEKKHSSSALYEDAFVVFSTKITFKPYVPAFINVSVDWSNAKASGLWYAKNSADIGTDEIHVTVPTKESNLREDADQLEFLLSDGFVNNGVVSRNIVMGGTGFSYNNYKYRLVFDESNIGKQFKGVSGRTYTLRISADGRQLLVGNNLIAELVLPDKFADKAGDIEEANYTMIKYAHSKIAHDLLNYCSHKEFDNKNDAVLNNFLDIALSLAIQNADECRPIRFESQSFNVRFIRPIDANVTNTTMQEENSGSKLSLYLNNVFEIKDWRGLWKDGYNDYYGIQGAKIDGLNDGDLLSTNHDVKINLNHTGMKPLYQVGGQIDLIYHEDNALGSYIEFFNNVSGIQDLKLEIPVDIEYIWDKITTTVTVTVIDGGEQGVVLNAANFPDANFRAALASILGINEGDEITEEKIAATTSLDVSSKSIADLKGIEHFTALEWLFCYNNQLTSLDVSKNTALTTFWCYGNQLTSLGVSQNTALAVLYCHENQLTSLDISKNTALTHLSCHKNKLISLDVSKNTALKHLICHTNQLTLLDVSKNTALTHLYCDDNHLSSLDVSKNTALLTDLRCSNNSLTSLDVSKNIALTTLHCYENQLTSLDVSGCTALTELLCYNNQLTALDVSKNTALVQFGCHNNQLTALDVSKNTALEQLRCSGNQLTTLDVSKNTALKNLVCYNNQLTSLDVTGCPALENFYCYNNQLTALDVSKNTALTLLRCDNNQLTTLDVSQNTTLTGLNCSNNQLTSLDVSKNTALTELYCGGNQLTLLDVSKNTALTRLDCYENQLTALGVSKNTALKNLVCYNNQLTALDVSKNTALTALVCFSNQIKGAAMDALVASLPTVTKGNFFVIDMKDENEGNVCTKSQVAVAKEKGWTVYDYNDNNRQEYEGSDPVAEDINPVDEDDNIDFGTDMNDGDDLNGNVIGDIYYNINTGDGGYDAAEGCIVVKKPTDDSTVNDLEGKDIFGEDFKSQFTGIVFKVPAGKGTIKVNAETTGNMLLKVKIGANAPVEMELNGKLKVTFPYNVSEPTYVYIYAGAANEAKGFGAPASGDAALKIYGIEFIRDNTPTDINSVDSGVLTNDSWYTIDGKKLAGEPKEKGIYIRNGKKVVK